VVPIQSCREVKNTQFKKVQMTYNNYTDQELVNRIAGADHGAFNEIYRRYWKPLLLIAWNHSQDEAVAKDIVQEVFLKLWERNGGLEINNVSAFLSTAVKFQVFKHYQKQQRRSELAKENYQFDELVSDEEKLDARFLQDFINGIVENMSERCKLVFRYSRNDGLKNAEIAKKINISEKGVESTLTRALKIIRKELKDNGLHILIVLETLLSVRR
jgi:RNA polymerase sigma-70 factor (family 1)